MHRSSTGYKLKRSKSVPNKNVGGFLCEKITGGGLFYWRNRGLYWPEPMFYSQKFLMFCIV